MNSDYFKELYLKKQKEKPNMLDKYEVNTEISKIIIPTFQITYINSSGFGAYSVEDEKDNSFSIKGVFVSELILGQTYLAKGKICIYKGEKQINITEIKNIKPINKKGIIAYLQTLKGLKSKAEIIYDKFGDDSIKILTETPLYVAETIRGIGKKSVTAWKEQLDKMKESQHTISSLLGYGLSMKQSRKLFDKYGDIIVQQIEENPYFLSLEVRGYGFDRCDRIARNIGYDPKSVFRIQEGIVHVLNEASSSGNCYLPKEELVIKTMYLLNIKLTAQEMNKLVVEKSGQDIFEYEIGTYKYEINYNDMKNAFELYTNEWNHREKEKLRYVVVSFEGKDIAQQITKVQHQQRIVFEDDRVYLHDLFYNEKHVAERICSLAIETPFSKSINIEKELDKFLKLKNISLEDMQRKAVIEFAKQSGGFFILNGSAGCGKTFTLKIILEMLKLQYKNSSKTLNIKVLAPTGKASKVAAKATGMECMTVHRGLKYNPQEGFEYNEANKLEENCIIVDESSMLDITLAENLLVAIADGSKVIFMGDTKQLPSVGAGNVLHDLISCGIVKVITLNVVKRQNEKSGIIRNANNIINDKPIKSCDDTKDAYVIYRSTPESALNTIVKSITNISKMDGFEFEDIQVLCPQKNGIIGTIYLNYTLQKEFNKNVDGLTVLNKRFQIQTSYGKAPEMLQLYFRKGDKVIHIKNHYDMEWYEKSYTGEYVIDPSTVEITNGECGVIEDIIRVKVNGDNKLRIIVKYEDKYVFYDDGYDELEHAYALTIHKSQGSSWKAIIIPIMKQNYNMLDNNLFYTGYTRAESFQVTIGQEEAIEYAIKTHKTIVRYTTLAERIQKLVA